MPHVYDHTGSQLPVANLYFAGRTYANHACELGNPVIDEPLFFMKPTSVLSTQEVVHFPLKTTIHHELEIVLYIVEGGYKIDQDKAYSHIGGFALGIDFTDRAMQNELKQKGHPWLLAKSFVNAAWVSQFHPPDIKKWSQKFWLRVNDRVVQSATLNSMLFSIPGLINYLSNRIPLLSGDIIFTGTPAGVGPIKAGDQLILGLGREVIGQLTVEKMNANNYSTL
jgi:acylpyruvate hydrolase